MNISLNSATYVLSYLQENILSSLTQQQKKILIIVSAAFACLAIFLVVRNCCFKASLPPSDGNEDDSKKVASPLAKEEEKKDVSPAKSPITPKKAEPDSPSKDLNKTEKRTRENGDVEEDLFVEDKLEGKGKIRRKDGTTIEGDFSKGRLVKGTIIDADGEINEGEFENDKLNGTGTQTLSDKTIRFGTFKHGKLEGQGSILIGGSATGDFYRGEFKNGKLNGKGLLERSDGSTFEGTFENDQLIDGKITYPAKHALVSIEGKIKDDQLNGKGEKTYLYGTVEEGEFENNELNGQGTRTYPKGGAVRRSLLDGAIQEGTFKKGFLEGKGKITYEDGSVSEGEFKVGELFNGKGKKIINGHVIGEGTFTNGFLQSQGKKTYKDGRIIEGEFKDGELHGYGKITHSNGKIEEGSYENGILVPEPVDEVIHPRADIDRHLPREPIYGNYALVYSTLTPFMTKEKEDLGQVLLQKSITFDEAQVIYQACKAKFSAQKFLKILFSLLDDKDLYESKQQVQYFAGLLTLLRARHQDEEVRMQTRTDFGRKILHRFIKHHYQPLEKEAESLFKAYFQNLNEEGLADATMLYQMKEPLTANPDDIMDPYTGKPFIRFVSDPSRTHVDPVEDRLRKLFNELYKAKKAELDPGKTLRLPNQIG